MAKNFNPAVLIWASGKVGQSVAAGECWGLANSALQKAGAGRSSDFGPTGGDADYIWGDEVSDLKDALPGDILQYRDFSQTTTTTTTAEFKDGFEQSDAPNAFNTPIILILSNTNIIRQVMRLMMATTIINPISTLRVTSCIFSQSNILGETSFTLLVSHVCGN